ncbi:tyrosine protein phosphatase [Nordella sp. HKS 07]|uniref:tyrosine phosphatase family protein n=1 Tax=Nordella sp. HKS 07 TaxID=2712222 RepID=UPI0013E14C2E|nr:tyrosine protein phosphatase [Nordella sp. HKS 07]QIG49254.1 tyrosine protein phosphatase [Nordella sp. HKS 07]
MEIIVSPLAAVQLLVNRHKVSHVVSLLGPETPHRSFSGIADDHHLKLTFHDITAPAEGLTAPASDHVEQLIAFLTTRQGQGDAPMLIHCWAGISRSTASAFTAMCLYNPDADEYQLAQQLRSLSHVATPNRRIVAFADDMLGRQGRMVDAIDAIGRGEDAYEGVIFQWKV